MARIFTIQFAHKGTQHHALVAVRQTPFHTEYKISMLDEELLLQLPSDLVYGTASGSLQFARCPREKHSPLMNEIISAIYGHIHLLQS